MRADVLIDLRLPVNAFIPTVGKGFDIYAIRVGMDIERRKKPGYVGQCAAMGMHGDKQPFFGF